MDEMIDLIEKLNLEIIDLKQSKEYKIGRALSNGINFKRLKNYMQRNKIKKFNAHRQLNNDFKYDNVKNHKDFSKIVVYTCITGDYDTVHEPLLRFPNVDYVLFTDNNNITSENWNIKKIPDNISKLDNILKNRYIKMHPHEIFCKKYDYAIYIDGNVKIISDVSNLIFAINKKYGIAMHNHQFRECIYDEVQTCKIKNKGNYIYLKKQIDNYYLKGFPKKYGLLEATIILSDLKNNNAKEIFEEWWNEFYNSKSYRDQIAFPYILWKKNIKVSELATLGNNVYRNPKFRIDVHD